MILGGCATIPSEDRIDHDPFEGLNRGVFAFNEGIDRAVLRPTAQAYRTLPQPVRTGVGNVFGNLGDVTTMVNNVLQGKPMDAVSDFMRISVNTVFGLGGLLDIASEMGMEKNNEDFGQTLGVYGIGAGPYLQLPLFGPSSGRDLPGRVVDVYTEPLPYLTRDDDLLRYSLTGLFVVHARAGLLPTEDLLESISSDRYVAIREAYLQRREFLVRDGKADLDDGLLDELDELEALDALDDE